MSGPEAIPDWAALARMAREKDAKVRQTEVTDFHQWLRGDQLEADES